MGNWGNGILQDDVADDVRIAFEDACTEGLSVAEATLRVLSNPPWPIDDVEDACTAHLALAALQLQSGVLTSEIRQKAIEATTSEWAIDRWEGSLEDNGAARARILSQFQAILEHGSCTLEELEQLTYPKEFSLW